jgi:hypothetical protein
MASGETIRDWTFREAKRRLRQVAAVHLPKHTAGMRLDRDGNRVVRCSCGWVGNGLGWLTHMEAVLGGAVRD